MRNRCGILLLAVVVLVALGAGLLPTAAVATVPNPQPDPGDLWAPAPGEVPAGGTYVYLDSDPGDYIGQGQERLYTPADASISITETSGHIDVGIDADAWWFGDFASPETATPIAPGYYADLTRFPFHDSSVGGLTWSGDGRGCNELTGWFVVDEVTFSSGHLQTLEFRFEQHCEGFGPALHGVVSYDASDTTSPAGPVQPPPAGLWRPDPAGLPVSGNYVWLDSEPGDYIGQGIDSLYQPVDNDITVSLSANALNVSVWGSDQWNGEFTGMSSIPKLEPGYYPGLQRSPFRNPTKGGLDWFGNGRGCNELSGWFVIDELVTWGSTLRSVTLRFEQHCEGGGPALHGVVHWEAAGGTGPFCGEVYPDVSSANPFCGEIGWATANDVVGGYADGTFRPQSPASRRAVVAMLYRLAGSPAGPFPDEQFSDVSPSDPLITAIEWAVDAGIVSGYADGTFRGDANVSRQAMVALLHRLAGSPPGPFSDPLFADVPGDSPFKTAINWAVDADIVQGLPDGTFRPTAPVSRQALTAFLYRFDGIGVI